jgi:cell division transport system permease protein
MAKQPRTTQRTGNISVIISITLVLFVLGIVSLLVLNTHRLSTYVKENIGISVFLKDSTNAAEATNFKKLLDVTNYVKTANYVSKQEAAKDLQKELGGEQFVAFLGYNPLNDLIDIRLKADYANNDSIKAIENQLMKNPLVKEVYYQKSLIDVVNANAKRISFILLGFSALLLIIAIALINNTIRLHIYAKRFLIKTMQLVGATQGFIHKPFFVRGIINGLIGAILAIASISGAMYYIYMQAPNFFTITDIDIALIVALIILCLGCVISVLSTYFALRKYLKLSFEDLYAR